MASKVVTGVCRLSYEHIWEARSIDGTQEPKFSACILIPKADTATVANVKAAIAAEVKAGWPSGKVPAGAKMPLKDGDTLVDSNGQPRSECVGMFVLNASSKSRPGVVGLDRQDIIDRDVVYSGCFCRFQIAFAPYDLPASKGVGCYLNNIQFVKDGDSLAGKQKAADAFADDFKPITDDAV